MKAPGSSTALCFAWLVAAVALRPAGAQEAVVGEPGGEVAAHVAALEEQRRGAMMGRDIATLELLFAPDAIYTHSNGWVQTRDELLAALADGSIDYRSITLSNQTIRAYQSVAVVTGGQWIEVWADGRPIKSESRFTAVYAVIEGDWRLVAYQSTPARARQLQQQVR